MGWKRCKRKHHTEILTQEFLKRLALLWIELGTKKKFCCWLSRLIRIKLRMFTGGWKKKYIKFSHALQSQVGAENDGFSMASSNWDVWVTRILLQVLQASFSSFFLSSRGGKTYEKTVSLHCYAGAEGGCNDERGHIVVTYNTYNSFWVLLWDCTTDSLIFCHRRKHWWIYISTFLLPGHSVSKK